MEKQLGRVVVIHGVFAPCEFKEYKFVDGGILDNVPTEEVKKLDVDKVIAVKFPTNKQENPKNIYEVAFRSIDILFEDRDKKCAKSSDFVLDINLDGASVFNTKKLNYCYDNGYVTAIANIKRIKEQLGL